MIFNSEMNKKKGEDAKNKRFVKRDVETSSEKKSLTQTKDQGEDTF